MGKFDKPINKDQYEINFEAAEKAKKLQKEKEEIEKLQKAAEEREDDILTNSGGRARR